MIAINATWGSLGNLLGLLHHGASWSFYADHGNFRLDNRKCYTAYKNGFQLKTDFAFTQGAVMTYPPIEKHELQHVLQHFIFGPIFTLTYALWFVLMLVPGAICGLVDELLSNKPNKDYWAALLEAVEAWTYYNNPYEVWAYAVEGSRKVNGSDTFIWGAAVSWIGTILYYLIGIAAFVLFLVYGAGIHLIPS